MFKNLLVWRSLHLALLAAKDEEISRLRGDLDTARQDTLRAETARDAAIAKTFELLTPPPPPPAPTPTLPPPRVARARAEAVDLAEIDPSDTKKIRDLAIAEMPVGKQSGSFLLQKMESIKGQILFARLAKSERSREVGILSAPDRVQALIDQAEQDGKDAAAAASGAN